MIYIIIVAFAVAFFAFLVYLAIELGKAAPKVEPSDPKSDEDPCPWSANNL